jgi:hypothetical protein
MIYSYSLIMSTGSIHALSPPHSRSSARLRAAASWNSRRSGESPVIRQRVRCGNRRHAFHPVSRVACHVRLPVWCPTDGARWTRRKEARARPNAQATATAAMDVRREGKPVKSAVSKISHSFVLVRCSFMHLDVLCLSLPCFGSVLFELSRSSGEATRRAADKWPPQRTR